MASAGRIVVVRNPRSGTAADAQALEQALAQHRVVATIVEAPSGQAFQPWIDRLAVDFDIVAAAGGDGTVSAAARAAAAARKTLAVIPTGTLNHFARDAGIPIDLEQSVALLRSGQPRCVDVGDVNGRLFLNNVSLGNYPRMVRARTDLEKRGLPARVAGAVAALATWWDLRKMSVTLTLDGRDLARRSPFIVIANGSYVLSGFALTRREQISDGHLSVYIAPPSGRIGALALPLRALAGTLERHEQFESLCATSVRLSIPGGRMAAGIDGEVVTLDTPLEFAIRRRALRVVMPAEGPA